MMSLRLLNGQGIAGIAVSLCLAVLLVIQKGDTRHWMDESTRFERLYRAEQSAFAGTVSNYRAAAETARAADLANAQRVASEQRAINQRSEDDFEVRLADARALAERLRIEARSGSADRGSRAAAPVPGLPAATRSAHQRAAQDRFPDALLATEQAIQLDELIRWVKAQAQVDSNAPTVASGDAD
jgi:hypothetical protein